MIPYAKHEVTQDDLNAVNSVLTSDFLTQGEAVPRFEEEMRSYCNVSFAVAANSATSALHMAYLAMDLKAGDIVWTSPITFVATANAALYCGARIDFIDIDVKTGNVCIERLSEMLEQASQKNSLPKIVTVVHFAGQSCDLKPIYNLSLRYGFRILEDAAHALGATYDGKPVGACDYSDICIFSFHPAKIITSGEGGVAVTKSSELCKKMQIFRSHGVERNFSAKKDSPREGWLYDQISLGCNYRMTDISAALGMSQLVRIDSYVRRRNRISALYNELLDGEMCIPLERGTLGLSACHLYVVRIKGESVEKTRRRVYNYMTESDILVNVHYRPIYKNTYYRSLNCSFSSCPRAEDFYNSALTLPLYPTLTDDQVVRVSSTFARAVELSWI